jgi:hypothetical protein
MTLFGHIFSLLLATIMFGQTAVAQQPSVSFQKQVLPLLERRCQLCHRDGNASGNLNLTRYADLRRGGRSGPVVVPGRPHESLMVQMISGDKPRMPMSGGPLTTPEVNLIELWIAQGAADDTHGTQTDATWWSLKPLLKPAVPASDSSWVRTPVDAFILAKLTEKGLTPSPEADRRTLIRRLTYDLHGLPPTPDEVRSFLQDPAPDAYERLVDRLLASPRYGERWGRHWLDVVHYGESHGYDKDKPRLNAWPYRDYVIRSFNEDKPYARFLEEQLAGDVLFPDDGQGVVATGFIAAGPWDFVGHVELREDTVDKSLARLVDRDDMVMTAMSTFLSLTVHCARCHDHKFDPILQTDYYRLQSVFAGVDRADRPYDLDPQIHRRRQAMLSERRQVRMALQPLRDEAERVTSDAISGLDQEIKALRAKLSSLATAQAGEVVPKDTSDPQRESIQREIEAAQGKRKTQVFSLLEPQTRARLLDLEDKLKEVDGKLNKLPSPQLVYAAANFFEPVDKFIPAWSPRPVHLLQRGSVEAPGPLMLPGAVAAVTELDASFGLDATSDDGQRRAALAKWTTHPRNPLTWRSIVNRIWHYHFGSGIVDSPNDFGRMGSLPTHPELLDWLAAEFRDSGGSLKQLHRQIVTSAVYRQSSQDQPQYAKIDSGNQFLWRMNRWRLDAESVRDSALAISGQLDLTMGGTSDQEFFFKNDHSPTYDYARFDVAKAPRHRRSVYRFLVRSVPDPLMESLDCPDASLLTPKRNTTLTALQALAMLNDPLLLQQAERFAGRLRTLSPDLEGQIEQACWFVLLRPPTKEEALQLSTYARTHGLENVCRLLLNSNEFMFVD